MTLLQLLKDKRVILAGSVLLSLLLVFCFTGRKGRGHSAGSFAPENALGWGSFQQASEILEGQGNIRILASDPDPSTETLTTFKSLLHDFPGMDLSGVEELPGIYTANPGVESLDSSHFILLLEQFPETDLVISFAGMPLMSNDEINYVKSMGIKFMVVSVTGDLPDARLLHKKLLQTVILPRLQKVPLSTYMPSTSEEWFEREYQVVTNARELLSWE